MNTEPTSDQTPASAFSLAAMDETRIPGERDHQSSAVLKINSEFVFRYLHVHCPDALEVTR